MTLTVNVHEATTPLSRLLEAASRGVEVIIARNGEPVARLVPVSPVPRAPRRRPWTGPPDGRVLQATACRGTRRLRGWALRLLLESHALLWWLLDDAELPASARWSIERAEVVRLSSASVWDVAVKQRLGKLPELALAVVELPGLVRQSGFVPLAIDERHAAAVASLPLHHRDPFDHLLIDQAQIEPLTPRQSRPAVRRLRGRKALPAPGTPRIDDHRIAAGIATHAAARSCRRRRTTCPASCRSWPAPAGVAGPPYRHAWGRRTGHRSSCGPRL